MTTTPTAAQTSADTKKSAKDAASQAAEALKDPELFSEASEKLALSVIMRAKDSEENTQHKLLALLSADDFYLDQHQVVWQIAGSLKDAGRPADAVSIADAAQRQQLHIGGPQYLGGLISDPVARAASHESVMEAAARIKEFSLLRRLQTSLKQGLTLCASGQSFSSVLSFVEDDLVNLRNTADTSRSGPRQMGTFIDTVLARVEKSLEGEVIMEGKATGFPILDDLTGGLVPETLTVIAARPSMGKTLFAMNIEQAIVARREPTLLFSLEMSGVTLATRAISRHGRIPLKNIKNVRMEDHQLSSFLDSVEYLKDVPCYIDDTPGLTLPEIRARARQFIAKHPDGTIMLDYLQLVTQDGKGQQDLRMHVGAVSKGLKNLARELKCPVVALAQLSRSLEQRANKRPMMSDLRESGQIEQDAEVIMFIYRDEVYNPDSPDKGFAEIIVAKNRDGATGTVRTAFQGEIMLMTEVGRVDHE